MFQSSISMPAKMKRQDIKKITDKTEKLTDRTENEKEAGHEIEKQISSPKLSELIREKLALPGLSVIFIKGKCRKY